ncbi:MAG TPA: Crp/Fnr family transcriptional regulator [Xanthobacteraceae bacterium]|nr:Crp/Fnr family transcriptional regulator [Xanthobacteraceae bacterium]
MTKVDISKVASDNFLLAALALPDFSLVLPHLKAASLEQGATLIEQDTPVDTIYFPLGGMISLVTAMDTGEVIELATAGHESAIGLFEALGRRPSFARAVAQMPGTALTMSAESARQLATKNARLRELSFCYEQALLAQLAQTAACNALHSLDRRLARWLLQTSDRVSTKSLILTQDFVSQMLGVSRTTVTLLAGKLQQADIIRYSRGHIEILDRARLEAASCECYHTINRRIAEAYQSCDVPPPAGNLDHEKLPERFPPHQM